ncbi:MAG: hypothetical protein WCA08_02510 [Desulfoferrobacter sp.]
MTTKRTKPASRFAICVDTDDPDLLTPRMVYQVLPDESAAKSDYLRVIDNEGEDYLYPSKYFVLVNFLQQVRQLLLGTKTPLIRSVAGERGRSIVKQQKSS